ncbi:MAG: hypothetical protein ACOC2W_00620 [bacterium]
MLKDWKDIITDSMISGNLDEMKKTVNTWLQDLRNRPNFNDEDEAKVLANNLLSDDNQHMRYMLKTIYPNNYKQQVVNSLLGRD